jgi:hypothetical protein
MTGEEPAIFPSHDRLSDLDGRVHALLDRAHPARS